MLNLQDAYEIIGIKEGASKDEIIKRYDLLLKKHRMSMTAETEGDKSDINIDDINKAYNMLMGYGNKEPEKEEAPLNTISGALLKKAGIDEKRAKNFFYYYKFHMLAIIIVLAIAGSIISSIVNNVEPDLNLIIAGEFQVNQTEALNNEIKQSLSSVKEISIDPIFLSEDPKSQVDISMRTKFVTLIAAGDLDVLILDRLNFEDLGKKGAFLSLDDIADQLGINKEANKNNVLKEEESGKEHLYGINVTNSPLLKNINSQGKEMIAAIRYNAKHYDNALSLIKLLVN